MTVEEVQEAFPNANKTSKAEIFEARRSQGEDALLKIKDFMFEKENFDIIFYFKNKKLSFIVFSYTNNNSIDRGISTFNRLNGVMSGKYGTAAKHEEKEGYATIIKSSTWNVEEIAVLLSFVAVKSSDELSYLDLIFRRKDKFTNNTTQIKPKTQEVAKSTNAPATMPTKSTGDWSYRQKIDEMTSATTYLASVRSSNFVEFSSPYNGKQQASLTVRDSKRSGKDILFSIEKGQILCRSYDQCKVLVRFDNEQPIYYSAVGASDQSSTTIFLNGHERFLAKLSKAQTIRISPEIYQQGSIIFTFDVSGFDNSKFKPTGK